ncbi:hypothetical protein F2Q70_00001820 [Brassica cretica]|uniref:Uncharacterized protein n=1 Tax=Brassica cretica TaxID=69181 RepID=A0A8S9IMW2_BRACR|nr:hypothetical protein F2Q70_00001820 [Brassica cretica]
MPSGFVIPLRMVALDCSGLVTPQQRVAPAPCSLLRVFKEWRAGSPTRSGWPLRVVLCRAGALGRCECPL